ncbi:MAG: TonB-dependent receptor [Gammaproteobacteria bacterium]|nr:TonB-dependent receptor [Gammaproteobacteria bacterium]
MRYRRSVLTGSALALLFSFGMAWAQDADDQVEEEEETEEEADAEGDVEEVLVTGSFIRRDNFDLPSPTAVLTDVDLELAGTPDLGDIIYDQTFQVGVNAYSAPFEFGGGDDQNWQQGGEVWANLRGLGTRATMTMMDGHRVPANVTGYSWWTRRAGTDLTNLYPGIAIGRVDTILDGASALYGSEAVSGVINLVPRKSFDGLMVNQEYEQPITNGAPSKRFSLLAGAQGERTSAIFALEIRDQERMKLVDRPEYVIASANWTGQNLPPYNEMGRGNPGDWQVPVRGANGELVPWRGDAWYQHNAVWHRESSWIDHGDNQGRVAVQRRADPGCGFPFGAGHDDYGGMREPLDASGDDPNKTVSNDDHISGLGYGDFNRFGSFYNGFMTAGTGAGPDWRGHRGISWWEGSEGDEPGNRDDCRQVIADYQDIRERRDQQQGMGYFEHSLNDYLKVKGEIVVSGMDYDTRDVVGNIDEWDRRNRYGRNTAIAIGSNPGNPFRAFADGSSALGFNNGACFPLIFDGATREAVMAGFATGSLVSSQNCNRRNELDYVDENGNGVYDYLQEPGEYLLFAQDSDGNGIPDRDADGDGLADCTGSGASLDCSGFERNPEYRVVLLPIDTDSDGDGIPDRFDPDMVGNGGVRLFEDVRMEEMSIAPKQPHGNTISWINDDMSYSRRRQIDNLRIRLGTEFNIPETEWYLDFDWIWATSKREEDYAEPVSHWTVASMRCQGGQFGDQCWNPFSTAWLDSTEDGQILPAWRDPDDPAANTTLEHRNAGVLLRHDQRNLGMNIIDATVSNTRLFDLWYNDSPVGLAAGIHYRLESEEYRPNQFGASALGSARADFQYTEEETRAVYMELQLPLINSPRWGDMEVQIAGRYAEFEGRGSIISGGDSAQFDTTIPKVAIRYAPTEWLAVRASLTQGFVLPGMFQLFQTTSNPNSRSTVRDYICDLMPELPDCGGASGGAITNVLTPSTRNASLGAEESDLWNAGVSLRFMDGDLSFDVDYTTVEFEGRVERLGAGANVNHNEIEFRPFMQAACPNSLLNYDNVSALGPDATMITPAEFLMNGSPDWEGTVEQELQCRRQAAIDWVANHERGLGGAVLVRGPGPGAETDNIRLLEAGNPWLNQGSQITDTIIYAGRFRFDSDEIPFIGGDYGTFETRLSATQMLELSLLRYAEGSGHRFEAIRVDGVGNRNNANWSAGVLGGELFWPLPPTPEWRVNLGLRWLYANHTMQLSVRWHDSLTDISASWDEIEDIPGAIDRGGTHNGRPIADWTESDSCTDQDRNPYCKIDSRHYWDISYTYNRPDFMGFGYVSLNVAMRNLFDTYPDPMPTGVGHETYVDNIMGRIGFARLTLGF